MDELIAFVRQQLDEDEQVASACPDKDWPQIGNGAGAVHIVRWDPARVLAEVEAKRRMLDQLWDGMTVWDPDGWAVDFTKLLAHPYAGRAGWRAEWAV